MSVSQTLNKALIRIENLSVVFDDVQILRKINLNIKPVLITCIIGQSGAGKSTLLRSIVRLISYSGEIYYNDTLTTNIPVSDLRKLITYVPQISNSFPGTCYENIAWGRSYWKLENSPKIIQNFMDLVGLDPSFINKSAESLSVGQLQKLGFARALAIEPDILLLDEPASALDAISKENFENIIKGIKVSNIDLTVVLVTHDIQQAKRIADEVIVLEKGKIILQKDVETFFATHGSGTDAEFLKNIISNGDQKHV